MTPRTHKVRSEKPKLRVQTSNRALYRVGLGGLVAMLLLALVLPYIPSISESVIPVRRVEASATMTVTTTADTVAADGACSLREALQANNTNATVNECLHDGLGGLDTINFNIAGPGPHEIAVTSPLPLITQTVLINGWSQPGFTGTPLIVLNGTGALGTDALDANGLTLFSGSGGSTIRGLVIQNFDNSGIRIQDSFNNTIVGNYVGTNATGTAAAANLGLFDGAGIEIVTANGNTIGGTNGLLVGNACTGDCNLVSGNGPTAGFVGVKIRDDAQNNTVLGNFIGSDVTGTLPIGNGRLGLQIINSDNNTIGGTTIAHRNVISGNVEAGLVVISYGGGGLEGTGNLIRNNFIGLNSAGTGSIPASVTTWPSDPWNYSDGIRIRNSPSNTVTGNYIGGLFGTAIRLQSYGFLVLTSGSINTDNMIVTNNYIGTDFSGTGALPNGEFGIFLQGASDSLIQGNIVNNNLRAIVVDHEYYDLGGPGPVAFIPSLNNRILGNTTTNNTNLGIDIVQRFTQSVPTFGVTANDANDADSGNNDQQNFPVLTSANVVSGPSLTVSGNLTTIAGTYQVEFFSSPSCDVLGNGEGSTYLGSTSVVVASTGVAQPFTATGLPSVALGNVITTTATSNNGGVGGETSEFSGCATVTSALPTVSINDPGSVVEGTGGGSTTITYTVTLSAASASTVTVPFSIGGTASGGGVDYTFTPASPLTFNPGVTSQNIVVTVNRDALDENDETVVVTLGSPSGANLDSNPANTIGDGTITDDDAAPTVSIDDVAVTEGTGAGTTTLTFTVTLSAASGLNINVPFSTSDVTATTADYTVTTTGPLIFAPGDTSETINVTITRDALNEINETFNVQLGTPTNATLDPTPANTLGVGTINDDDTVPTVSIDDVAVTEGTGAGTTTLTFTVTLSAASGQLVTVPFTAADVTATSADYSVTTVSPLTFTPGTTTQSIAVNITRDALDEVNETFNVQLGTPTNATLDLTPANTLGVGTINDDDNAPTVSINDPTAITEGTGAGTTTLTFTVTLSAASGQTVTVPFTVADVTATSADYSVTTVSPLTFTPGTTTQNISVDITRDALDEVNETFTITLGTPTNAGLDPVVANTIGVGTINDDDAAPTVNIDDVAVTEGTGAGTTTLTFTVTLSAASGQTVTVPFTTSNGTATGADYAVTTASPLTFTPGTTTQNISVDITRDSIDEPNETFNVQLGVPTNATLDPTPANTLGIGTINDDDAPPTISISDVALAEGTGVGTTTMNFNVTLSSASAFTVTAPFTVADGTATSPADYTVTTTSPLTINPGTTTVQVQATIVRDNIDEPIETFTITLDTPTNATLDSDPNAIEGVGTILDDDAAPVVSINDVAITEGTGGTTTLTFTVSLTNPSSQIVTVPFTSANGTATGVDYSVTTTSPLTFNPGVTTQNIAVNIVTDALDENNEDFTVTLQAPTNGTLDPVVANTIGVGTINDDDAAPTVSIDDVAITEGTGGTTTLTFTVTLSAASGLNVSVPFTSANGTATGADYSVTTSSPISITAGLTTQTIAINIVTDALDEANEDFTVTLQTPTNATLDPVVANTIGVGTINDDDAAPTVSIDDVSVTEGTGAGTTTLTYTVTLSAASGQTVTVPFTVANVTATSPADYSVTTSSPLTFTPGQTTQNIAVDVVRDATDEPDETFTVTLGTPTNATLDPVVANTIGVGTINNDDGPPQASIDDVTVNESAGTLTFTVSLSSASGQTVTVPFVSAPGTATTPADYSVTTVSPLTFNPGVTTQSITVNIVNDTLDEANEDFTVTLQTPTNATLDPVVANTIGVGTINDNDNPPTVSIDDVTVNESAGTLTFTVTLSTMSGQVVNVPFVSANGTATSPADFSVTTVSPLTFNVGVTTQNITVNIVDDTTDEPAEDFTVTLQAPTNATLDPVVANTIGVGTINDNDNPPTVSINDVSVTEGTGAGTTTLTYTVTLSAVSGFTVSVPFTAAPGTATSPADYSVTTISPLTFNPGVTTQNIAVDIVRDATDEPNETFTVTLGSPTNADLDPVVANTIGIGTINNDDGPPLVSIDDVAVNENAGTLTFTVSLSAISGQTVSVPFTSAAGTATTPADYNVTTVSPLTFSAGDTSETITVNIVNDTLDENNETFTVTLGTPTNAVLDPTPANTIGVGTINDDDNPPTVSIDDVVVTEGTGAGTTTLTYTVTLSTASGLTVTVPFTSAAGTAATPADYTVATVSPLTFNPGVTTQNITVNVIRDALDEVNEDFTVTLGSPTNADLDPVVANTIGVGTIDDDDNAPTVSIDDVAVTEGTGAGTTTLTFTVTLSAPSGLTVIAPFSSADVTATVADYSVTTVSPLIFNPGVTTQTIAVNIVRDATDEPNETFNVTLSFPTNATLDPTPANTIGIGTINDDDGEPLVSINDVTLTEGTGGTTTMTFTVSLSAASGQTVTVPFTSANGTATGADYSVTTVSPLTFNPGVTTQNIAVNIVTDNLDENDETFTITLGSPTNAVVDGTPGAGVGIGTITDDDSAPVVSINDVTVVEGTGGTNNMTFTVSLTNPSSFSVNVPFTYSNGTAGAADYTVVTASPLVFNPGTTSQSIVVNIVTDAIDEPNETFNVTLGAPTNATLTAVVADRTGVGTITDDDVPPTVSINDVSITEGTGAGTTNLTFTVTLSDPSGFAVTVPFSVADVTATNPADYTVTTASPLSFSVGVTTRTIVISVVRDAIDENNETLQVTLGAPTNATLDPTPANTIGDGTINDDDGAGVTVTQTGGNTTVVESPAPTASQMDTFNVRLASQPTASVTVTLTVSDGQTRIGRVGGPYSTSLNLTFLPSGSPTAPDTLWNVNQTVEVVAVDDAVVEAVIHTGVINFAVQNGAATEYNSLSVAPLNVRVQDNDGPDSLAIFTPNASQASLLNTLQDLPASGAYNTFAPGAPFLGQGLMGDWDGDGQKTPGVYGSGVFAYTNTIGPSATWTGIWFGLPGPAVAGRFNGSLSNDCIGVVSSADLPPYGLAFGLYFTCNLTSGPVPGLSFQWLSVILPDSGGFTGAFQFTAGDWDGNGTDTIAIRRSEFIAYTNVPPAPNTSGYPYSLAQFNLAQYIGNPTPLAGDVLSGQYGTVVSGDWDSNGVDSFGLYYPAGYFYYRNDLLWNSGLYTLQRVAQPIGTETIATSWRAGVGGVAGASTGEAQATTTESTPTPTTGRVTTVIESDDPQVTRDGQWTVQAAPAASGSHYVYSGGSTDDILTLEFVGTSVEVIYVESQMTGTFTILVDDVAVRTVITTGDATEFNSRTLINYLPDGSHTLQIVPISGTVAVDAFVVTQETTE